MISCILERIFYREEEGGMKKGSERVGGRSVLERVVLLLRFKVQRELEVGDWSVDGLFSIWSREIFFFFWDKVSERTLKEVQNLLFFLLSWRLICKCCVYNPDNMIWGLTCRTQLWKLTSILLFCFLLFYKAAGKHDIKIKLQLPSILSGAAL